MNFTNLIAIVTSCLMLTACNVGGSNEPEHQHTYSEEWTYDERAHWHAATCEHTEEVLGWGAHTLVDNITRERGDFVDGLNEAHCSICQYKKDFVIDSREKVFTSLAEFIKVDELKNPIEISNTNGYYLSRAQIPAEEEKIVITRTYNDLPLLAIGGGSKEYNTFIIDGVFSYTLHQVYIPSTVLYIETNAMQFRYEDTEVEFGGTIAQWESITLEEDWIHIGGVKPLSKVKCSDGYSTRVS